MSEWKEYSLKDVGKVITGKTPSKNNPEDWGVKMPFITPSDYKNYRKKAASAERYLSDEGINRLNNKVLPVGTTMVTCIGSDMGKVALNTLPVITNQQINSIIPNVNIADSDFLFYSLVSIYVTLRIYGGDGTAVPIVNKGDFENLEILLPPLPEQKAIAAVLSSLDDKIDLLHRQNQTLEALAETLFRQWFVEEGSMLRSITEFVVLNPKRNLAKNSIAPYLEMANVSTVVFHPQHWFNREFKSGSKFVNGDTLLARITPCLENGKSTFVTFLDEQQVGWGSTEFIVMRSKENLHPLFSYILAKNKDFRDFAEGCLEGSSGRQRVNIDHLKNYELFLPDGEKLSQFNNAAASIMPKLNSNFIQIRTLGKLRDTLLPKLMSGEVRVKI